MHGVVLLDSWPCTLHGNGPRNNQEQAKMKFGFHFSAVNIGYSPAERSELGKTVPEVLDAARGRRPRAVLRPRAQFFPIRTDLRR